MSNNIPKYRTTQRSYINGAFYSAGVEVEFHGWPKDAVEPVNDEARRVSDYYAKYRHSPWLPATPYDQRSGGVYLPALIGGRQEGDGLRLETRDLPEAPRYRVRRGVQFRVAELAEGQEVVYLGWPTSDLPLDPINEPARSVVEYFQENYRSGFLPVCPWCECKQGLHLPKLPAQKPQGSPLFENQTA